MDCRLPQPTSSRSASWIVDDPCEHHQGTDVPTKAAELSIVFRDERRLSAQVAREHIGLAAQSDHGEPMSGVRIGLDHPIAKHDVEHRYLRIIAVRSEDPNVGTGLASEGRSVDVARQRHGRRSRCGTRTRNRWRCPCRGRQLLMVDATTTTQEIRRLHPPARPDRVRRAGGDCAVRDVTGFVLDNATGSRVQGGDSGGPMFLAYFGNWYLGGIASTTGPSGSGGRVAWRTVPAGWTACTSFIDC